MEIRQTDYCLIESKVMRCTGKIMANSATSIRLRLPGREADATRPNQGHPEVAQFLNIKEKKAVDVDVSLRGASVDTIVFDAQPEDVIELQYEGGLCQWIRADQLCEDLEKRNGFVGKGSTDNHEVVIPPDLGLPPSRGGVDLLLKGLKILGIDPVGDAANLALRAVIAKFEDAVQPAPGLYVLSDPRTVERQVHDAKELDSRAPYLLFLHGTASSVAGSFGGLAPAADETDEPVSPEDWNALTQKYPGRILGLQHKTLSVSPVQNALDVARFLPPGAPLHLVSHSRGGLIGELLCLNELPKEYLKPFARLPEDVGEDVSKEVEAARADEAECVEQLSMELGRKRFAVQRFVRVACPARGTVLASKRLDLYLSVLLNVFGLIPGLKTSILYTLLKAVTLETARRRADPRQLPGIEAMMPESPLINLLNQKDLRSTADLAVIAGDLAPDGIWQKLKTLAVDLFYSQANDLVVNTSAMYGGMERRATASYFFNKGPHVNHFHYFRNPGTRSLLRKWLEAGKGETVEGFRSFAPNQTLFVADERRGTDTLEPRPMVFVVPDLMGTQLKDESGFIWPTLSGLAKRGLDRLANLSNGVMSGGLIPELYAPMVNRLQRQYRVEPVGYDWRKGFDEIVNSLRSILRPCLEEKAFENQPFHFIAHGTGGLALLGLATADPPLWAQITRREGRIILLGVPFQGCAALDLLKDAKAPLNRLLRMADHQSESKPEEVFKLFKSIEDFRPESVPKLRLPDPRKIGNLLAVIGKAERTVCGMKEDGTVLYTTAGDGLVTFEASRAEGVATWEADAPHGMLGRHDLLTESLLDLLGQGDAPKLRRVAAAPSVAEPGQAPVEELLFFPTEEDLLDAALGGKPPSQFELAERPVKVSVSHGHLRQASFPVMVGHYQSDTIVSAEKALDTQLDGRLTQRFNMGVYPGRVGTDEIVLTPGGRPPGALVIGLGEVGELTPEKLRRGVRAATLRYALLLIEQTQAPQKGPLAANFSTVLMGTYGQGSVRDSLSAVVHGVLDANRQLRDQQLENRVCVEKIEIIETYRDVAAQAAHELLTLAERLNGDAASGALIAVEPRVVVREGGCISRPANPYAVGWWRRIKINQRPVQPGEVRPADGLEFTVLTDRARAEDYVRGTQRQVLKPLLQKATRETLWNEQLSTVLFQLLVPRDLRSYLQDRVNVVLVVDEEAANYPWELLAQRTRGGVEPLAVQFGLIRQLRSTSSERRMPPASGKAVLIVGDTQSGWSELKGAQAEAEAVNSRLKAEYKCTLLKKENSLAIVSALLSQELRIVHLAGHGNFDPNDSTQCGMKIGPDQWLTPDILDGMLAAPDLAFVNCCHLGAIEGAREGTPSPQLAASFAVKLMNLGTKAVVAAGWAVNDLAAGAFADRFYQRMLEGERFGDAVLDARKRTKELYPLCNTWGAYQCYGNPDFRLNLMRVGSTDGRRSRRFVSRDEILQNVTDIASQAGHPNQEQMLDQLTDLRSETPKEWRDGEMLAAFGYAYGQLGKFEEAIATYRQALVDEKGGAPLWVAQQIANLLDRSAKKATGVERTKLQKEALDWIDKVAALADTTELAALRAGYYKRTGDFAKALIAYEQSVEFHKRARSDGFYYPGLNAAALAYLLPAGDGEVWLRRIQEFAEAATRQREEKRDFWARAGVVDANLLASLWKGTLADDRSEIAQAYLIVIKEGGSPREIDSILGQLEFLLENLPENHVACGPLRDILNEVKKSLSNRSSLTNVGDFSGEIVG
jgi:CHAT domain-containing protein